MLRCEWVCFANCLVGLQLNISAQTIAEASEEVHQVSRYCRWHNDHPSILLCAMIHMLNEINVS